MVNRNETPNGSDEQQPILGFMGPPGNGKSVAINIVEDAGNREELGRLLGLDGPLNVGVARKSTSRKSRGADDRFKKSGLPVEAFDDPNMIGVYRLANNNSLYGYHVDDLRAPAGTNLLISEPSLHHIADLKEYAAGADAAVSSEQAKSRAKFYVIFFASDRTYRLQRLNGRGTEDPVEVQKRVLEGDHQIIMASMNGAEMKRGPEELTDPTMVALFSAVRAAKGDAELARATAELDRYLAAFVGGDKDAAATYGAETARLYSADIRHIALGNNKSIDKVITFDDSYIVQNPIREGKFRGEIMDQAVNLLKD